MQSHLTNADLHPHTHLVISAVKRVKRRVPSHIESDDLRQAGMIGLWQALQSFSTIGTATFDTWATRRIEGAMLDELRRLDWLPRHLRKTGEFMEVPFDAPDIFDSLVSPDDLEAEYAVKQQCVAATAEIDLLPPAKQRLLIQLCLEERPLVEFALELRVSQARISQMKFEIIELLAKRLRLRGF